METNKIYQGNSLKVLKTLPDESIDCVMTSPPYWALRDYGVEEQLGLESTFKEYIKKLCNIFDEVKRVLKKEGTCWVNIGDSYIGSGKGGTNKKYKKKHTSFGKHMNNEVMGMPTNNQSLPSKCLGMIPSRFAIEMCNRGWVLRNEIIWHKPNCMPSSVKDRFTVDFEKILFFVKNKKYYFKQQLEKHIWADKDKRSKIRDGVKSMGKSVLGKYAINKVVYGENGKNMRSVWKINTKPFLEAHFATYPKKLCEIPLKAGCRDGGIVLDPFFGAGTTGIVALKQDKKFIGIELNPEYIKIAEKRLKPFLEQKNLNDFY